MTIRQCLATLATGGMLLATPALAQNSGKHPPVIYVPPTVAPAIPHPMPSEAVAAAELPATPAKLALGREIAVLLNDGEVMHIQFDKMFNETMPKQLGADPNFQVLEKQYPGLIVYLVTASRPVIEKAMTERAPALYDRLARIYATHLTEAELDEMLDFYHSPAGNWLVLQMARGMDMGSLFSRALANPDMKLAPGDLTDAQRGAVGSFLPQMPPEYRVALMRLAASPILPKLGTLNPLLAAAAADWGNELPPELKQQVGVAMLEAMQRYIAQAKAKK